MLHEICVCFLQYPNICVPANRIKAIKIAHFSLWVNNYFKVDTQDAVEFILRQGCLSLS
jgi:hypothetical protein